MRKGYKFFSVAFSSLFILVFLSQPVTYAQDGAMTYTVDESFDSGMLVAGNGGVGTIVPYSDGRLLLAGDFDHVTSPFDAIGMVWGDGSLYSQWFQLWQGPTSVSDVLVQDDGIVLSTIVSMGKLTPNGEPWLYAYGYDWIDDDLFGGLLGPYYVENTWTLYGHSDGSVLIGGAFAVDTLQPDVLRNLVRFLPNGTLDASFPPIITQPNDWTSRIAEIFQTVDGKWIISGRFHTVNDHETAFIARLNSDFSVDTTFVSPLEYVFTFSEPNVVFMDSQERMWVSGRYIVTLDQPYDTLNMVRLLPSGIVDTTFNVKRVEVNYPPGSLDIGSTVARLYGGIELEDTDRYLLYGRFNFWNDTVQSNITVVNDAGYIQDNYFLGDGATEHEVNPDMFQVPMIGAVAALPDGSLIVGGEFSTFMGATRQNLIKLNPGTIGVDERSFDPSISIHPNPSNGWVKVHRDNMDEANLAVYDLSGRIIFRTAWWSHSIQIDTQDFVPGMYLLQIKTNRSTTTKKLVVE